MWTSAEYMLPHNSGIQSDECEHPHGNPIIWILSKITLKKHHYLQKSFGKCDYSTQKSFGKCDYITQKSFGKCEFSLLFQLTTSKEGDIIHPRQKKEP